MALNNSEASAVNVLVHYVCGEPRYAGDRYTHEEAVQALGELADKANKQLMAGVNGAHVRQHWPAPGTVIPGRWSVYAIYVDNDQPYETTVDAADEEAAKKIAQEVCVSDNGGDPNEPGDCELFRLHHFDVNPATVGRS